ncbi:MAG: hypothetical protein ACQEP1_00920 [Nanobdellota archaeon]
MANDIESEYEKKLGTIYEDAIRNALKEIIENCNTSSDELKKSLKRVPLPKRYEIKDAREEVYNSFISYLKKPMEDLRKEFDISNDPLKKVEDKKRFIKRHLKIYQKDTDPKDFAKALVKKTTPLKVKV